MPNNGQLTRDGKKLQMQLNFEKRNLKSCNGSLGFIRKWPKWQNFLMQFYTTLCLSCNFILKNNYFSYFFHENNDFAIEILKPV